MSPPASCGCTGCTSGLVLGTVSRLCDAVYEMEVFVPDFHSLDYVQGMAKGLRDYQQRGLLWIMCAWPYFLV